MGVVKVVAIGVPFLYIKSDVALALRLLESLLYGIVSHEARSNIPKIDHFAWGQSQSTARQG